MYLNFFPIEFEFDNYNYHVVRVRSQQGLLGRLRKEYNPTHSFFQHGDYIYISNKQGSDLEIGETVELSLFKDHQVTASLIKHIFFKTFLENYPGYKLSGFYPFVIQSLKPENDLIRKFLPRGLQGRLCYVKQVEAQIRRCIVDEEEKFGFVVNVDRQWKLDISCLELNDKQFNLVGYEVIHSVPIQGLENILLPDESLIGTIKSVNEDVATVDTNDGEQQYKLEELYLRKTTKNIKSFLSFALRSTEKADKVLSKLKKKKIQAFKPKSVVDSIEEATKILFFNNSGQRNFYENKDGFCFKVNLTGNATYKSFRLDRPLFVFDPSRVRTNTGNDYGLRSYGPYDSSLFSPKEPRVLVVCHKETRGRATQFLKELIDGMPQSRYFTKGFRSKYELHQVHIDIQEINSFEISEIKRVTRRLKHEPHIAIIEIPVSFKEIKLVSKSLYYQAKAHFLGLGIPIQIVTSEIIKDYDEYKLNAIALQMYAKIGGIPWTIQTKESVDREIVVGIAHSIFRENAFSGSEQERIVAISTFFSADGQYLMSGEIKDVEYEEYFHELLGSLKDSINTLSREYAWRRNDTVRLIFHIFKPIKNTEFDVIKELVREIKEYNVQFAFVTVSEYHPFVLFDPNQTGIEKFGKKIGELVPFRGTNIVVNESTCLIQMLGIKEMKTDRHGGSKPLLIKILQPSSYKFEADDDLAPLLFSDLHYITQQIFNFSCLSWRSFFPNQKPATMLYSFLISKLLGKLRKMPGWKSEVINFNLKHKKWFL